jgi:hypothetical protein
MQLDRDIKQSQFIFSESKCTYLNYLYPSKKKGAPMYSFPLEHHYEINPGDKFIGYVKPFKNSFRIKLLIASIGE